MAKKGGEAMSAYTLAERIRERAKEFFKCDRCTGTGRIIFYDKDFGPCEKCHGAREDTDAADKATAFALSELSAAEKAAKELQDWKDSAMVNRVRQRAGEFYIRKQSAEAEAMMRLADEIERDATRAHKELGEYIAEDGRREAEFRRVMKAPRPEPKLERGEKHGKR